MKVVQVNAFVNTRSTGRIAEDLGRVLLAEGHESYIAYARPPQPSASQLIRIGKLHDIAWHGVMTRVFDRHGLASTRATQRLVKDLEDLQPDVFHLHGLHGYFINYRVLFNFLLRYSKPLLWTLHDCWAFTGHCVHFEHVGCERWKTQCFSCPNKKEYPGSLIADRSYKNYNEKKQLFSATQKTVLVTPSHWLAHLVKQSFLQHHEVRVIPNGVDLTRFTPLADREAFKRRMGLEGQRILLGVASNWNDSRKGLSDFQQLAPLLDARTTLVLIGVSKAQQKALPPNVRGILRTESVEELAAWYSAAEAFVNPTWEDNFPTTNLEALACGTPVITYNSGGSPEAIDVATGKVVQKGQLQELCAAVEALSALHPDDLRTHCRQRAEKLYNKEERYKEYLALYTTMHNASS